MIDGLPEIPERRFEDYPELPFSAIREKLDDLLVAMANLIDRRWPVKYADRIDLKLFLLGTVKITENTYRSIRHLCADKPEDVSRRLEFAVSVPPLARTILDSLFTVVYLFDDVDNRVGWFRRSGWREVFEEHKRYQKAYGVEAAWAEYLDLQKAFLDHDQHELNITDKEADDPKKIKWWPNPGKMIHDGDTTDDRTRYMSYLNDWFYKTLSADSHLSWPGFARRAIHFMDKDENQRVNRLRKYKSDCFVTAITLVLVLLSEIECEFRFGRTGRLKEVWNSLSEVFLEAKEIFEFRYADRL